MTQGNDELPLFEQTVPLEAEPLEDDDEAPDEESTPALDVPPKDRKLVTQPFDFIVGSLENQIKAKDLILQDDFQRRKVWTDRKASSLIESLLMNVPIPVCYFAEINDGVYSVIDGQQRLTSVYRYMTNIFPLTGLRVRPELNGKRFVELDPGDQRLIRTRTIRCIAIMKESHPDIRFDIFQRLNSSGVPLNPQELRNAIYRGALNNLIRTLCDDKVFQRVRKVSDKDARMGDAEMILRFFAFHYDAPKYRSVYARFLDNYLKDGQSFDDRRIAAHRSLFHETIEKVNNIFGDRAFRQISGAGYHNQVNRAIFDVVMLSFARIPKERLVALRNEIIDGLRNLCMNDEFKTAIGGATRDRNRVNARLRLWTAKMREIGLTECPEIKVG